MRLGSLVKQLAHDSIERLNTSKHDERPDRTSIILSSAASGETEGSGGEKQTKNLPERRCSNFHFLHPANPQQHTRDARLLLFATGTGITLERSQQQVLRRYLTLQHVNMNRRKHSSRWVERDKRGEGRESALPLTGDCTLHDFMAPPREGCGETSCLRGFVQKSTTKLALPKHQRRRKHKEVTTRWAGLRGSWDSATDI